MKYTAKCVIRRDNKVLLIKHQNEPQGWAIPGGMIEEGETAEEGIKRELKEEFRIEPEHFKKVLELKDNDEHLIIFECRLSGKIEIKINRNEIKEVGWFKLSDLPDNLGPRTQKVISALN